jgi:nitrate reductase beta subunit
MSVIKAAQQSPVYKLAVDWKLALPLHPEYRTLPMVWYVPPLSPIQNAAQAGKVGMNGILPDVDSLRIPLRYLANLLTAGDEKPVKLALKRLLAMRAYKRAQNVDGNRKPGSAEGCWPEQGSGRRHVPLSGHRQLRRPLCHSDGAS